MENQGNKDGSASGGDGSASTVMPSSSAYDGGGTLGDGSSGGINSNVNPGHAMPDYKLRIGLEFNCLDDAKTAYNEFGRIAGFSSRIDYSNTSKKTGKVTSRRFVCSKEGFRREDKRDNKTINPRQETRTGCKAHMTVVFNKRSEKYEVTAFIDVHNHPLHIQECVHMMPSQRKMTNVQAIEADLVEASGIRLRSSFELAFRQTGGRESLGFTRVDLKNYLRTKRQRDIKFGEAGSLLAYFSDKAMKNSSFHYTMQFDAEEQITNIFWADPKMIIDYSLFGDFVSFDTTYRTHKDYRPLAVFVGFNNYRKTVIFGAALLYDETIASFEWLFNSFLNVMSGKKPKTIFTDQDPAMANAISSVMPDTYHRICTWHMRQNAIKHLGSIYAGDYGGIGAYLSKFIYDYEDEESFCVAWEEMLDRYDIRGNSWLPTIYRVREKWARPYVMSVWSAWADTTQVSESFNAKLRNFLQSDLGILHFFKHFERVVEDVNYTELECEYASRQKLPKVGLPIPLLITAGEFYTNQIFDLFREQYLKSLGAFAWKNDENYLLHEYMVKVSDEQLVRKVKVNVQGPMVECTCRLFERCGILCAHALKGLDMMNIKEIPKSYLLNRWAKNAKNGMVKDISTSVGPHAVVELDINSRYRILCPNLIKLGCRAAESMETTNMLMKFTVEMTKEIDDILSQQGNKTQASPCPQYIPQESQSDAFKVKGLKKKEGLGKGRPRKRPKSWVELQQKRPKIRKPPIPASTNKPKVSIENPTMVSHMIPETPQPNNHPSMTHLFQNFQGYEITQYSQSAESNVNNLV